MAKHNHPMGRRRSNLLSRVVGYYQTELRRCLEHFFPDGDLEQVGDRVFIRMDETSRGRNSCFPNEDGMCMELNWFRSSYRFHSGVPSPFLPSEQQLIKTIVQVIDQRYHSMIDPAAARPERIHFTIEDVIVAHYADPTDSDRIPTSIETLKVAGLSTYENRRVSTGALLLGTSCDPAAPVRQKPAGAPRYNVRLPAIKSFHRLCDGMNTVFLVDNEGDLMWPVDIGRWASQVQGHEPLPDQLPCPKPYHDHAKATRSGGHVCLVLTPHQEIKVFAHGTMMFAFSDARWRLLDIPAKFQVWKLAVETSPTRPTDLASLIFRAALNLSENRQGALFVVLRDPEASLRQLVDVRDLIAPAVFDDPEDPDNHSPKLAKQALHHLVRGQSIEDVDPSVIESLAQIDGAFVTDLRGRMLAFGAILRIAHNVDQSSRVAEGARTSAALNASFHGPVLKVSEDGFLTMFLGGRRIWEI